MVGDDAGCITSLELTISYLRLKQRPERLQDVSVEESGSSNSMAVKCRTPKPAIHAKTMARLGI